MVLFNLFVEFFKIGLFGFGGGYAMIPLMAQAVREHQWISQQQFTDIIAIAGSAPGPIATNTALFIGYQTSGILGAGIAAAGNLLPSLIMVLLLIKVITKNARSNAVNHSLYGIHPVITALILYAGVRMGIENDLFSQVADYPQYGIMALAIILFYKKVSPLWVIGLSGIAGILIYS
ncbi:chromate transporter [Halobacillus naozhouensis]|uniref:Chromate transporter n=1 Tax=Halobacillus naozhouensis TaxID=554880 RepID=A0ABY8J0V3_9BACI|nr:chromate transporter [Halobacillus naozhouensis]WFT76123.1 chromate transporter [Halobacillus naozhouensis]